MSSVKKFLLVSFVVFVVGSLFLSQNDTGVAVGPRVALAQAKSCPDVVKAALATTNQKCASTGRNKACYGNTALNAEAQPGTAKFTFAKPGDTASLSTLRVVHLSALDATAKTWGIVVLRIQANLPDTAPGQNVTMLMFGDVGLTDGPNGAALVSSNPATAPAKSAAPAATVAATKSAASSKPMTAFYFRTGVGEPACDEAPRDGILIQSPEGSKQKVTVSADGTQLDLGSTAFLEAQAGGELKVSTLEGSVAVTAFGRTETATTGKRVRVPLNATLNSSGTPTPPEDYDYSTMVAMPVNNLPRKVSIPVPKPPANAVSSTWSGPMGGGGTCLGQGTYPETATISEDPSGNTLWWSGPGPDTRDGVLTKTGPDTFKGAVEFDPDIGGETWHVTLHFTSPTHMEVQGPVTGLCAGDYLDGKLDKVS